MKRFLPILLVFSVMAATEAAGQQPSPRTDEKPAPAVDPLMDTAPPTPELWLYMQQLRRYDDPKTAVRRNAEFRAAQRRSRIAAKKWFGLSNQRPRANPVPLMSQYAPMWIGNGYGPEQWVGWGYGPYYGYSAAAVDRVDAYRR